jgi:hypothetical protein
MPALPSIYRQVNLFVLFDTFDLTTFALLTPFMEESKTYMFSRLEENPLKRFFLASK